MTTNVGSITDTHLNEAQESEKDAVDCFLDVEQLLKRLPISRGTLRNWMANGSIPYIKAQGRRIIFDWPSVRESLLRRQRGGMQ